jgi:ribosomal protein S18 acetylase RimI-like enzyme
MDPLKIVYTDNPTSEEINFLYKGLSQYALEKKDMPLIKQWGFLLKNKQGDLQGGITGCFLYGCLVIDTLMISPSFRNQGYGTKLMQLAEELGSKNKCTFSTVNTMDWEAKGFYEKLGYQVEFTRHGYSNNSTFYFLRKNK